VSPEPSYEIAYSGDYDFGAFVGRIEYAVQGVSAKRAVLDSIGAKFSTFPDAGRERHELFRMAAALRNMEVTAILTAERKEDYGPIARHDVEEFVVDGVIIVIIMRNVLKDEKRRHSIEIPKFRGTSRHKGEYPFTVQTQRGIIVIPLAAI